jgi:hypothetical protein
VTLDEHGVLTLNPTFFGYNRQSWNPEIGILHLQGLNRKNKDSTPS